MSDRILVMRDGEVVKEVALQHHLSEQWESSLLGHLDQNFQADSTLMWVCRCFGLETSGRCKSI